MMVENFLELALLRAFLDLDRMVADEVAVQQVWDHT